MLPLMNDALGGLTDQVQLAILNKTQENFNTVETIKTVGYFLACLQPLHPRQVAVKPEGLRRWKWWSMWTKQDIPVDNYIQDQGGLQYRVMSKNDWSRAGYIEYELIESSDVGSEAS